MGARGEKRKLVMSTNLMKALGVGAVFAVLSAGSAFAAVATGSVNVRSGPGTWYAKVDTLFSGERVAITDQAGSWCYVQKSGPDGWVSCRFLVGGGGGGVFRAPQPNVRINLGFGMGSPMPTHHHHHHGDWDNNNDWNGDGGYWSGPGSATTYPDGGGSFTIY